MKSKTVWTRYIGKRKLHKVSYGKRSLTGILFVLPSFLGVSIFVLIPYMDVVRRSFLRAVSGEFVGIENYKNVFANGAFQLAVKNTVCFMLVSVPLLVMLSLFIAVALEELAKRELRPRFRREQKEWRREKKSRWGAAQFKAGFLLPMAIPVASVVLLWKALFHEKGFLNGWLDCIGVTGADWMNTGYAFGVLVFS